MPGELSGDQELVAALRGLQARIAAVTPQAVAQAAHAVEAHAKRLLSLTSHPPGTPTPSSPGSPPSLVSGALRRSIMMSGPVQTGDGTWTAYIGSHRVYAAIQEHGGVAGRGAHLPARPYLTPAFVLAAPDVERIMTEHWVRALD